MTKEDRDKELDGIATSRIKLGQLAGQLGSFVGQSESVKKAVENAIIAVFNNNADLKNDLNDAYSPHVSNLSESVKSAGKGVGTDVIDQLKQKVTQKITETNAEIKRIESLNKLPNPSLLSPSLSADSAELQSKLDALKEVKELCGFYENSNNQQNDPKKLLDNLCDGLETFLGFNSASKGYDGQGIVYSDLDRLCDGVMGFLSGVLGAVKDDDAVKTYDKYITPDDKKLKSVLEKLQSSIGSGRAGLAESVRAVKEWLEGYGNALWSMTYNVTNELGKLKDEKINEYIKFVAGANSRPLKEQLETWISILGSISDVLLKIDNEHVNLLDNELRDKIMHEMRCVEKSVQVLKESAGMEELRRQVEKVDDELVRQQSKLTTDIKQRSLELKSELKLKETEVIESSTTQFNNMQEKLVELFNSVGRKMITLDTIKKEQFNSVTISVRSAQKFLLENFDADYKTQIENKFAELSSALVSITPTMTNGRNVSTLKTKFTAISTEVSTIGEGVNSENDRLREWKTKAEAAVGSAILRCLEILEKVNTTNDPTKTEIGKKAKMLQDKATQLLKATRSAHEKLAKLVLDIQTQVEKLNEHIVDDLIALKRGSERSVEEHIKGIINAILAAAGDAKSTVTYGAFEALKNGMLNGKLGELIKTVDTSNLLAIRIQGFLRDLKTTLNLKYKSTVDTLSDEQQPVAKGIITEFKDKATVVFKKPEQMKGNAYENLDTVMHNYHEKTQKGQPLQNAIDAVNKALDDFTNDIPDSGKALPNGVSDIPNELKNVEKQFSNITDELKVIANFVDSSKPLPQQLSGKPTGYQNADKKYGVRDYLVDMQRMLRCEDIKDYELQSDVSGTVRRLSEIHNELVALRTRITQVTSSDSAEIDRIIDQLQSVPQQVADAKMQTDGRMVELRQKIQDQLYDMNEAINNTEKKLTDAIQTARQTLSSTYEAVDKAVSKLRIDLKVTVQTAFGRCRNAVTQLNMHILNEVKQTFMSVKSDVQTLFATHRKSDLEALRELLVRQKNAIFDIFKNDMKSSVKGLIKTLNGHGEYTLETIATLVTPTNPKTPYDPTKFPELCGKFQDYVDYISMYVKYQLDGVDDAEPDSQPETPDPLAALLVGLTGNVDKLLSKLERSGHFNYEFRENLDALASALREFTPSKFGGPCTVLLDVVKGGVKQLAGELDKAYVSRYSGHKVQWTEGDDGKETLTRNAMKCGKVLLSVIPMFGELMRINQECMSKEWYKKIIFRRNENNPVAKFLEESGYSIPSSDTKQEGDLRCGLTTLGIADRLSKESKLCTYMGRDDGTLKILYDSLKRYNEVCHLTLHSKPRHPCSVFDMLVWLTSLSYNSVYLDLTSAGFSDLFDKPEKKDADDKKKESGEDEPMVTDLNTQTLAAYPRNVTYGGIQDAITHITHKAHELLVTIVGTGDASTIYSCDLSNNSLGFKYPTTATDCLQMLIDVLCALLPSLRYLERQCSLANQHSGWAKCFYGKGVKSFKWPCNDHSSDKATCQPNAKPNCQPNGQPNCQPNGQPNCQPNCQPSSPLMSYLNDCLPGHMPHRLQSVGCKAECKTCPTGQPGMPCITPLGFKAFSGSIKTGKELCNIIREFLGHEYISGLLSLMPKPPSTLPQHFGFMLSIVRGWVDSAKLRNQRYTKNSFQSCFETSIASQSIRLYSDPSELTKAFTNAYGSQSVMHETCNYPHLVNLTSADICSNPSDKVDCAPYLMSLCDDSYYYVGYKHAGAYLSWAVYLPWTFWRYLNSLYNEFCNISCNDWGCSKCMHGDMCKPGKHGHVDEKSGISHCQCPSIVGCRGVSSTLYKFGFTFDDAKFLNRLTSAKTCTNFCTLLKSILHSQYFTDLFTECDNFIWTIREPFTYLVLALWSLSLFYLICVMVGRLDVLHIRSHLRIPSSHRITAQSLLAAAQVGRLAKISYLQP